MRALAIMYAEEQYQAWGNVLHSVRTGETAFDQQFGMNYVGGDFFIEVPGGGDAYLLAQILHDWNDERSVAILRQCRRVVPAQGRLLVIELVLPQGEEPFFGKWLDLHMLVMLGARERTEAEYAALFRTAGFELSRIAATRAGPSVIEAVPA